MNNTMMDNSAPTEGYLPYTDFERRSKPLSQIQSLWKVSDDFYSSPEERFMQGDSPFVDAIMNQQMGPLEAAPIPKGLVAFVEDMVKRFGVGHSEHVCIADVVEKVCCFMDYTEPYYLLCDSPVELNPGAQIANTFRSKVSGSVMQPDQIECFQVKKGYDFKQYKKANELLMHPATQAVLDGSVVNKTGGGRVTKQDIIDKLCDVMWGNPHFMRTWVEEWLFNFYESATGSGVDSVYLSGLEKAQSSDLPFWQIAAIGSLMWFKSPFALSYLVDYHPIYAAVLRWNKEGNHPEVIPESGGIAVVEGWTIFTAEDLIMETGVQGGACASCKQPLHCSKLVNSWAVVEPICSCGEEISIEVDYTQQPQHEHRGPACQPYKMKYPNSDRTDYVCIRCLFNKINRLPVETRCGRSRCPATDCVHHAGQQSYVRSLTQHRVALLGGPQVRH